jgi:hypothetical protein
MGKGVWVLALFALAGCVIPGSGLNETDRELLSVPRRVSYNVYSDPFYPADMQVYKCKSNGTIVPVAVESLDYVGIIVNPDDAGGGEVSERLDPVTGSYTFQSAGRYDVVMSCNDGAMTGRYSISVQDPTGLEAGEGGSPGGKQPGGGIEIEW